MCWKAVKYPRRAFFHKLFMPHSESGVKVLDSPAIVGATRPIQGATVDEVTLYFIMYLIAVVLFVVSAFQLATAKVNLISLGLAFAFAVPLIQTLHKL